MKRLTLLILVLSVTVILCGCTKITAPIADDTTEEISEIAEPVVSETEIQTEEINQTPITSTVTEEITEPETQESPDRETAEVTIPVIKPITQSYIEVYELKDTSVDLQKYVVSTSEYAVPVVFEASGDITDLKICGVEMTYGYDEITDTVLEGIDLSDGERISVMLEFPGDMSTWYYSYTNNVGKTCEHQIYMSGMDGSIVSTHWQ